MHGICCADDGSYLLSRELHFRNRNMALTLSGGESGVYLFVSDVLPWQLSTINVWQPVKGPLHVTVLTLLAPP
jgi:hypothetical protein